MSEPGYYEIGSPARVAGVVSADSHRPLPSIPDYELLRVIGRGAYGEVWLARNVTGSFVALKIVQRAAFDHDRPFEREFEGIKRFEPISRSDPSQVAILHVGRGEGYFYYVMELADDANVGQAPSLSGTKGDLLTAETGATPVLRYSPLTLKRLLNDRSALPADECLAIALSLTRALAHLHGHGLVHRDVKPSNVIFVNGQAKLADIGLVTSVDATRSFVGTEGYLPPEGAGTPQADLYSLGKVLYEMSTGCDRKEFPALPTDIATRPDRDALAELNAIVVRACQLDPRERYASAEAMRADLELLQAGHSVKRQRAWERGWRRAKSLALPAIGLALVSAALTVALHEPNRTRPLSSVPEALKLYEQAKYLGQSSTLKEILQANSNLLVAVKLDPQFVDAYYLLTETYWAWGDQLPPHKNERANLQWGADQIHRLRPDSAQYHTVNGYIKFLDWRFDEALREAELAVKLDPRFLRARGLYAGFSLIARGDATTALREFRAAEEIGPADVTIQTHLGTPYYFLRDYTKAIEQFQRAYRLEQRASLPREFLARAYAGNKQYKESLDSYEAVEKLMDGDAKEIEARYKRWRSVLSEKGPHALWETQLLEHPRPPYWSDHYERARLHARLGNTNEVFASLNKAWDARSGGLRWLLVDDCWDAFRDDRQFKELLEKVGYSRVPGRMR